MLQDGAVLAFEVGKVVALVRAPFSRPPWHKLNA